MDALKSGCIRPPNSTLAQCDFSLAKSSQREGGGGGGGSVFTGISQQSVSKHANARTWYKTGQADVAHGTHREMPKPWQLMQPLQVLTILRQPEAAVAPATHNTTATCASNSPGVMFLSFIFLPFMFLQFF